MSITEDEVAFTFVNISNLLAISCDGKWCEHCGYKIKTESTDCAKGKLRRILAVGSSHGTLKSKEDLVFIMKAVKENITDVCSLKDTTFCRSTCGYRQNNEKKRFCGRANIRTILNSVKNYEGF